MQSSLSTKPKPEADALNGNISDLYNKLVQEGVNAALFREGCLTSEGLKQLLEETEQVLDEVAKAIKGGSANKQKYERDRQILQELNSYSKTEYDATFMRMKERDSLFTSLEIRK